MNTQPESVPIPCDVEHETPAAILIRVESGDQHWIPLSQVNRINYPKDGGATIFMTPWIAKKKGLI